MPTVNESEFWQRVGQILASARGERTYSLMKKETGIDAKTLQSIEAGRPGVVEKLSQYSKALGLDLIDVMRSVLSVEGLTPQASELRRLFDGMSQQARDSLLGVARLYGRTVAASPTDPGSPLALQHPKRRKE